MGGGGGGGGAGGGGGGGRAGADSARRRWVWIFFFFFLCRGGVPSRLLPDSAPAGPPPTTVPLQTWELYVIVSELNYMNYILKRGL